MARQFRTPIRFDTGASGHTIENADGTRAVIWGAGAPEGSVTASIGAIYLRTDGSTGTTMYIKESGTSNTGWVAVADGSAALATHEADTTNIHGIADTSVLATTTDIATHSADTTSVHGITDTSVLAVTNADNNFTTSQSITGTLTASDIKGNLETATFSKSGTLAVVTGSHRYYLDAAYTIVEARASVGTAPTGASLIVDVNKNGTTIFTTQANRPTIAASGFTDGSNAPDVTSLVDGDYLTVDIDQVGSTVAGSDLTVQVLLRRA